MSCQLFCYLVTGLVVMSFFVDMSVFQFFFIRLTQRHNLHIEVQFRTSQRMIEIQTHRIAFDAIHTRITRMPFLIADR